MASEYYSARLRCLKSIFKDRDTLIDMELFVDKLAEKDLISMAQEWQIKHKAYSTQIDETFYILFQRNPQPTYECVLQVLDEMQRDDIKTRLFNSFAKMSYRAVSGPFGCQPSLKKMYFKRKS
ncbi:unnamed protein product [Darwinula stevensoni]|uniref:Uncharacterized protein n=1 Tax=Darwinula stevensoni TaxID=69355 RepID=A0A7R9A8B5_9CRUS|nr:unnamed protein product [Darwinula stevensoni]CAG0896246.1 unnamed protein product [Darwinula stevensoni]